MSGFDSKDNVMVMAATNFPELLDPALLRSGRFSRQITIDYPDETQREAMLKYYSSKLKLPVGYDLAEATALTKTFTPADIKEVVNSAAIKAVRAKSPRVSLGDLNEAINEVISKDIRKPDDPKLLDLVTAHECGHVLMEVLLKNTVPTKVTNYAYGGAGGFTQPSNVLTGIVKDVDILNEVKMLLGGRAAEQVCMKYVTTGASNDLEKAKAWLKKYYSAYNFETYSVKDLDQRVVDTIDSLYKETLDALETNKAYLNALVSELSAKRVLYSSDIAALVAPLLTAKKGMHP
jgi:cell division protease FtsH